MIFVKILQGFRNATHLSVEAPQNLACFAGVVHSKSEEGLTPPQYCLTNSEYDFRYLDNQRQS